MVDIRPCTTHEEVEATYPIAFQLYDFPKDEYVRLIEEMMQADYHLIAAFDEGEMVGISGYRIGRRLYCGKYLHVDNLIVDMRHRHQGIAADLIEWMKNEAIRLKCEVMLADTYMGNIPAQALFKGEGFATRGYHLKMDL